MKLSGLRFALFWNGSQYNISGAVEDFLVNQGHETISIISPLLPGEIPRRTIRNRNGDLVSVRERKARVSPPFSYLIDPLHVYRLPKVDVAICFSTHLTPALILLKRIGRIKKVIQWNIDYSPQRFGNRYLNCLYNRLDRFSFTHSDIQIDLTQSALNARTKRYLISSNNIHRVVPVGIWRNSIEPICSSNFDEPRVVFLGNLSSRLGIEVFIDSIPKIAKFVPHARFDVIGASLNISSFMSRAESLGISHLISWHGNQEEEGIRSILIRSTIASAPYLRDPNSFSNFADPSKIKHYLQFGIPIVMTDVPPIANKLFEEGAAVKCLDSAESFSATVVSVLNDRNCWLGLRDSSGKLALEFSWEKILGNLLDSDIRNLF